MLITEQIAMLRARQQLVEVPFLDWRGVRKRNMYVTPDVASFLTQKSSYAGTNKDRRALQALIDSFVRGDYVSIALEPSQMSTNMKRLSPADAEVWELKVVRMAGKGRVQFRMFGRFAALNVFIILTGPVDRISIDYASEKVQCQQKWQELFGGQPPVHGRYGHDYVWPNGVALGDS